VLLGTATVASTCRDRSNNPSGRRPVYQFRPARAGAVRADLRVRERFSRHRERGGNGDLYPGAAGAFSSLSIAEGPAKRRDMNPEISLFDERARPDSGNQFPVTDNLIRVLSQSNQDIQRSASEMDRLAILQKQLLRWNKLKSPE
jgi:hypothetical protein